MSTCTCPPRYACPHGDDVGVAFGRPGNTDDRVTGTSGADDDAGGGAPVVPTGIRLRRARGGGVRLPAPARRLGQVGAEGCPGVGVLISPGRAWRCPTRLHTCHPCSAGGGCVISAFRLVGAVAAAMLLAAACTIAGLCVGFRTVATVRRARRRVYGFRRAVVAPISEPLALYDDPTDTATAAPALTLHLVHPVDSPSSPRKRGRWLFGRGSGRASAGGLGGGGGLLGGLVRAGLPWTPWAVRRDAAVDEETGGGGDSGGGGGGGGGDAGGGVGSGGALAPTGSPVGCILGELSPAGGSPSAATDRWGAAGTPASAASPGCRATPIVGDDGREVLLPPPPSSSWSTPRDGDVAVPLPAEGEARSPPGHRPCTARSPDVRSPGVRSPQVLYSPLGAAGDKGEVSSSREGVGTP